jgi:hypothetical protein
MSDETLRLLAKLYDAYDRGDSEVDHHLRAHGWQFIGDHWMGPDEIERVTKVCKHCGERFEPFDPWTTGRSSVVNTCHSRESPDPYVEHEPLEL